jgi:hypothetical protein
MSSVDDFALPARARPGLTFPNAIQQGDGTVIYEMRTYRVQPGKAGEFLKFYEQNGLAVIARYARLAGCWTTESGTLNSVVFLWRYDGYGQRSDQRAKLAADPEWQRFVPTLLPWLVHQESVFLAPAPFSPAA